MISCLDQARVASSDPLDVPMAAFAFTSRTGKRGRPRIEMDPNTLATALGLSSKTRISGIARCSTRTLRRREIDYRINTPEPNQQHRHPHDDAIVNQEPGVHEVIDEDANRPDEAIGDGLDRVDGVTDEELDLAVACVVENFPGFGRRLTAASLRARGLRVPESRVRESLVRVNGAPGRFGGRSVHRRRYKVAGVNSLWHHDGQHGKFSFLYPRMRLSYA